MRLEKKGGVKINETLDCNCTIMECHLKKLRAGCIQQKNYIALITRKEVHP